MIASREALVADAQRLQRSNQVGEAVAAYQRVLTQWPQDANSWYNLGLLFRSTGQFDEALVCYQSAIDLGIANPEQVYLNRGVIYSDYLRRYAEAERELLAALAANPEFVPALLNLANIHEDRGARAAALELYDRALQLDPANPLALARLASMQSATDIDAALLERLREAMARPGAGAGERALLGFALGRARDATGAYDQAFEAYAQANEAVRADALRHGLRYDRLGQEQIIDRMIRLGRPAPGRTAPLMRAGPKPIFVCGMFRSGSTLAEQLLSQYPGVAAGGELATLPALVANELQPYPESLASLTTANLGRLAQQYQHAVAAMFPDSARITDKRIENFLHLGLIKALFPDARIVHTTRDPLDNCLAVYFLHLDPAISYATDLLDIGHYYRQYARLMAHWRAEFGDDIVELNYDRYVREPHAVAEPVFAALGLDWNPRYIDQRSAQPVRTASVWQVRDPLYRHSSGRWHHYQTQLAPLREYLADLLPD